MRVDILVVGIAHVTWVPFLVAVEDIADSCIDELVLPVAKFKCRDDSGVVRRCELIEERYAEKVVGLRAPARANHGKLQRGNLIARELRQSPPPQDIDDHWIPVAVAGRR